MKILSWLKHKEISEIEQLRTQLAGCSVAALGWNKEPAKQGDYGWSPAYQDVLELRRKYDKLVKSSPSPQRRGSRMRYRNKQGLYEEILSPEPAKSILDWFRDPLKKIGKLYGITFVTLKPFPQPKKEEVGK